jgi:hypothetical protein
MRSIEQLHTKRKEESIHTPYNVEEEEKNNQLLEAESKMFKIQCVRNGKWKIQCELARTNSIRAD